jgi:hypothetical protein
MSIAKIHGNFVPKQKDLILRNKIIEVLICQFNKFHKNNKK